MQYNAAFLALVSVIFVGCFIIAILGSERRVRVALQLLGWVVAGIVTRYMVAFACGFQVPEQWSTELWAMLIGIGASLARMRRNQMIRIADSSAE